MLWLTARWDASVLALLFEAGDDRHLPGRAAPGGFRGFAMWPGPAMSSGPGGPGGLFRCGMRRLRRWCGPDRSWRDRFLLVLLWFCGLRVGEALGLCRSDLHLVPAAAALGCAVPGPHLYVVGRDNPNRARAKSGTPTGFVDTIRSGTMVYEERTGRGTGSQEVHPGI